MTGSIFRLNDDGTTPADNPFFAAGAAIGGEVGANIQKLFSYGHRNDFGLAFDPLSGNLWNTENGDDSFDEINKVVAGGNYGWVQTMGPISRIVQFKTIEMNFSPRYGVHGHAPAAPLPDHADRLYPCTGPARMFALPGATSGPEMSWRTPCPHRASAS